MIDANTFGDKILECNSHVRHAMLKIIFTLNVEKDNSWDEREKDNPRYFKETRDTKW